MLQQDYRFYKDLDSIVSKSIGFLSELVNVNTIFFATNDTETNFIERVFNRYSLLIQAEEQMPFNQVLCSLVTSSEEDALVISELKTNVLTKNHPVTQSNGNGCFFGGAYKT